MEYIGRDGGTNLTRIHGVDEGYHDRRQDARMRSLNAEQIARLRTHGVD